VRHLARKQGMAVAVARGEASARVDLVPGNVSTLAREFIAEHVGLFDVALKAHVLNARRLAEALTGAGASAALPAATQAAPDAAARAATDAGTGASADAEPGVATDAERGPAAGAPGAAS
jgi:hypothetical protein